MTFIGIISLLCDGSALLLFHHSLGSRGGLWVTRSNSIRMTDARSPGSSAPALLHSFIPLWEKRSSFTWWWGFTKGIILPLVFYSNVLMLLLSGSLQGTFPPHLYNHCVQADEPTFPLQEYSTLPNCERDFFFSRGKYWDCNLPAGNFQFSCGIRAAWALTPPTQSSACLS